MTEKPKKPYVHRLKVFSGGDSTSQPNAENFGRPAGYYDKNPEARTVDDKVSEDVGEIKKAATQGNDMGDTMSAEKIDLVLPPYDLKFLTDLNTISVTRRACVEAKATNVAGLGYLIRYTDPDEFETAHDVISERVRQQLEKWATKGNSSFAQLIYKVKVDEESTGNGYIEVSRNRKGQIDGLYHIPAHTMRVKRDRSGYVQVLQGATRNIPFYNFGDKFELKEDGTHELREDRDTGINEIIHFALYSSKSNYYGVPMDIAAIPTIMGDEAARDHNNKFFKFSATPEIALVFSIDADSIPTTHGDQPIHVEIDPNTKREIEEHFRRNLAAKTFEPAIFHLPPGVKLEIEKLSSEQKDAGWTNFRTANKDEIREAHRTPRVILGMDGANYATAETLKVIYLEQVILPQQERYEHRLMDLLWPELVMIKPVEVPAIMDESGEIEIRPVRVVTPSDGTGVDRFRWQLDFKEFSVADKAVDATVDNVYVSLEVVTINEVRERLGMKAVPWGNRPVSTMDGERPDLSITNLGNGRGPNGQVKPNARRRVGDVDGGFTPDNASTVHQPNADARGVQ